MSSGSVGASVNRNDPCPCGSGRKYKKCCLGKPSGARSAGEPAIDVATLAEEAATQVAAGRLGEAVRTYRRVLRGDPRHPDALFELGRLMGLRGSLDQGIGLLRGAIAVTPERAEAHAYLAEMLLQVGRSREALEQAARAIALDPNDAATHCTAASCHERHNRLDDAVHAVDRALALDPEDANAGVIRARLHRLQDELDAARDRLEAIVARVARPGLRSLALAELGLVRDRLGDYAAAYEAFAAAGVDEATHPQVRAIDGGLVSRRVARYRAELTPEIVGRWRGERLDERGAPTFLVGFARSGTTMTEQVLAACSGVVTSDEQPLIRAVRTELGRRFGDHEDVVTMLAALDRDGVRALRQLYWTEAERRLGIPLGGRHLVDKNPMDLVELGLINVVFPDAKVIVALRDPRDVCLSCFMQMFRPNPAMVNFLSLERTVAFYAEVMDLWLHLRPMLTLDFIEVRYEDTVADLEGQARRLLTFLDLAWSDDVLRFHERAQDRFISTPSAAAVKEPVHRRAVGRWHRYETPLRPLLPTLQRFVEEFGYGGAGAS